MAGTEPKDRSPFRRVVVIETAMWIKETIAQALEYQGQQEAGGGLHFEAASDERRILEPERSGVRRLMPSKIGG